MYNLKELLEKVASKKISVNEAEKKIKILTIDSIENIANIDSFRELRKGIPEVILAEGKSSEDLIKIINQMVSVNGRAIVSRFNDQQLKKIRDIDLKDASLKVYLKAKMAILEKKDFHYDSSGGKIGIITAGTSDIPIAEEAKIISEAMGCQVFTAYDLGVAGIHRFLKPLRNMIMKDIDVLVVIAGREGALASVIAGMVNVPVIAVPTSNSYGLGAKGVSTLMAMLQSCSLGLAVVNIDGGLAAGSIATLIANRVAEFRKQND